MAYLRSAALQVIPAGGNDWTTNAAGGILTNYKTGGTFYQVHTFFESGLFEVNKTLSCDMLIVAGGGPSGGYAGTNQYKDWPGGQGGGGAGGMGEISSLSVPAGAYTVTVGRGGRCRKLAGDSTVGTNSVFSGSGVTDMTCYAGGRGGTYGYSAPTNFEDGGSGGGGDQNGGGGAGTDGSGGTMTYYGNAGSNGSSNAGGGGGGAGGAGGTSAENGGTSGAGRNNLIRTGVNFLYASGGGHINHVAQHFDPDHGTGDGGQPGGTDGSHGIVVIRYAV